jgi:hypothetical protein
MALRSCRLYCDCVVVDAIAIRARATRDVKYHIDSMPDSRKRRNETSGVKLKSSKKRVVPAEPNDDDAVDRPTQSRANKRNTEDVDSANDTGITHVDNDVDNEAPEEVQTASAQQSVQADLRGQQQAKKWYVPFADCHVE